MSQNNWDDTFRAYVIEKIQYCRCRYSVIPIRLTTHFDISFYYFDPWPTWFDSTGWSFDCCRNQRLPLRWWRRRRRPCTRKTRRTPWTLISTWTEWMFPSSDAGSSRPDLIPASGLLRSFPVPGVSEISDFCRTEKSRISRIRFPLRFFGREVVLRRLDFWRRDDRRLCPDVAMVAAIFDPQTLGSILIERQRVWDRDWIWIGL